MAQTVSKNKIRIEWIDATPRDYQILQEPYKFTIEVTNADLIGKINNSHDELMMIAGGITASAFPNYQPKVLKATLI